MVAFRKLFPVLAIAGLFLGSQKANAQSTPLTCIANAGVPPIVRAEGLTELVGDIVLTCTGGQGVPQFNANFQIFLNTNITSRLVASDVSEALLLIDEPLVPRAEAPGVVTPLCVSPSAVSNPNPLGAGTCNDPAAGAPATYQRGTYTVFKAQPTSQQNAVIWAGVPIVPPGTNSATRTFRFTNIRANASVIGAATTLIPNQITAFISVSASQSLAINNPQQTVAYVQRGLIFDVRNCVNDASSNPAFSQCVSRNSDVVNNPSRTGNTTADFGLRFTEGFPTAFKPRIQAGQELSVPGVVFNSESGFVRNNDANLSRVGDADSGTRIAARFRDIPDTVRLFVTVTNVVPSTSVIPVTPRARLVSAGAQGEGSIFPVSATTRIGCTDTTSPQTIDAAGNLVGSVGSALNAAQIATTGGVATAVWEIESSNPSQIDALFFLVAVGYIATPASATPAVGQARVNGTFAPFYAGANDVTNAAGRASTSLPVPRFLENTDLINAFNINACETVLLFPFVTAQAGFDTGIAISNTSADTFSNPNDRRQNGRCTIHYFGNVTGGGAAPNSQETNADVPAGGQLTFVLSSGGNFGVAGTPGFQGYIIARCLFRYAHGFAFITDGPIGTARVAEGYLGLVMTVDPFDDDRGRLAESLGN